MKLGLRVAARSEQPPRLIVVTDLHIAETDVLVERVRLVLGAAVPGSVIVQLRDVDRGARDRLALGERLVAQCRDAGQYFVVNDRLDLAVLLGADGVHLGEASVSTEDARRVPELSDAWLSRACHAVDGLSGVDAVAVLLSPAAAPRKGRDSLGTEAFRRARAALAAVSGASRPLLFALGGIDSENASKFREAGADGVAVIGAVLDGREPLPLLDALGIRR